MPLPFDLDQTWEPNGKVTIEGMPDLVAFENDFTRPRSGQRNRFLFRGASDSAFRLDPSLFRILGSEGFKNIQQLYNLEAELLAEFKRKAPLYSPQHRFPVGDSIEAMIQWWQIMQHYRAPTRLLDWSSSLYVAAYFAVVDAPEKDGVVWAVDFGAHLDRMSHDLYKDQFKRPGGPIVILQAVRFCPDPELTSGPKLGVAKDIDTNNASLEDEFSASLYFTPAANPTDRMANQQGWFSFASALSARHDEAIAKAFHNHPDEKWARKIVISKDAKAEILRKLRGMNITAESIFPGLDGLGKSLAEWPTLQKPQSPKDGKAGINFQMLEGVLTCMDPPKIRVEKKS